MDAALPRGEESSKHMRPVYPRGILRRMEELEEGTCSKGPGNMPGRLPDRYCKHHDYKEKMKNGS